MVIVFDRLQPNYVNTVRAQRWLTMLPLVTMYIVHCLAGVRFFSVYLREMYVMRFTPSK